MKTELSSEISMPISDLVTEVFGGGLTGILGSQIDLSISESFSTDSDGLMENYQDQTLVVATEEGSGFETGLMFVTRDVTYLTNLMVMMDEDGHDDLSDDDKDAVKELASQLLASLNVPIEERMEKKVSFRVDDVMKNELAALFQAEEYHCFDLSININSREIKFRLFMDSELGNMLASPESGGDIGGLGDFGDMDGGFSFPDDGGGGPFSLDGMGDFDDSGDSAGTMSAGAPQNLEMLLDIDVPVSVKMGATRMFLKDILSMGPGNVVELDESADEPVELVINDKVIARGEVVIVDGYFGLRIKEIVSKAERIKKLKD